MIIVNIKLLFLNNILIYMECPICYEYITISAIPSCTHHFCYSCLAKWTIEKSNPNIILHFSSLK